ncbi:amine oxidase flavin-containing superfamily [Grosmannia clavigera kw1407]|uniref:Amine oxidase flavin-containing superfamily n=1 Tax=Grosmannia clavigera (strain kw1407 / UAMH 11150) TaxID=655863 RepID=F0X896_GROCL|nr:amine oxidase flavin-containing superfamily [Grosmannia clavigera kw1407]EFX05568.1 amine oxidase flavin-containing superfamily [Grosmannia clavigera kw1407]
MISPAYLSVVAALASCCGAFSNCSFGAQYANASYKSVDVVIVGGGSSGSNAAVHLKDAGLDVLVVEKNTQLGGMVNSWTDPSTGTVYDYGVAAYTNYTGTLDFFARLGINVTTASSLAVESTYVDMSTGLAINYTAPSLTDEVVALEKYYNISSQYADLYLPSYANWPAPTDIPEDLLLPFRDFAQKYDLDAALFLLWWTIVSGLGNMLDAPTLYVFQTFGPTTAAAFLGEAPEWVPESRRNQDIYDKIAEILGAPAVMTNSLVVSAQRLADNDGVTLVVEDQTTMAYTIVNAKRLVMAIEPTASNVEPFDMDTKETAVFAKGNWSAVNTGIITHPSLPVDGQINNLPAAAENGNYYAYPTVPFVDYFSYIGDNRWQVIVGSWYGITDVEAQAIASEAIEKMAAAGTIPATNGTKMEVLSWSNHGAMDMRVTADDLKAGYIQEQYSLQGYRSTYWTGAAFSSQLSTFLWAYNEQYLVPLVATDLT